MGEISVEHRVILRLVKEAFPHASLNFAAERADELFGNDTEAAELFAGLASFAAMAAGRK